MADDTSAWKPVDEDTSAWKPVEEPSVLQRASANLPGSIVNSLIRVAKGPIMGEGGMVQRNPNAASVPDRGPLGNIWESMPLVSHPLRTVGEAFANDPVSVAQVPFTLAARGGWNALPQEIKAGAKGALGAAGREVPTLAEKLPFVGPFVRETMRIGPKVAEGAREAFRKAIPLPAGPSEKWTAAPEPSGNLPFTSKIGGNLAPEPRPITGPQRIVPQARKLPLWKSLPEIEGKVGTSEIGGNVAPALPQPRGGEQLGIHGGVENTPIKPTNEPQAHPPFATGPPFSSSKVARQLHNVGTMAEGTEPPIVPTPTLMERLRETGALPIAKKLRQALGRK